MNKDMYRKSGEFIFFSFLGGSFFLLGFSKKLSKLKRSEKKNVSFNETGEQLAMRAFKKSSLYTVLGFTAICCLTSFCFGIRSFQDIKDITNKLNLKQNVKVDETNKFQSLHEIVDYIIKSK